MTPFGRFADLDRQTARAASARAAVAARARWMALALTNSARNGWWAGCDALAALAVPFECPVCGAPGSGGRGTPFCDDCREELLDAAGPACRSCAMPVGPYADADACRNCRGRRLGFDEAVALGPYQGPLRALCLMLKHEREAWLARWVTELLVEARPVLREFDAGSLVVPVPLHWRRQWSRGYNQADALAVALGRVLGLRHARPLKRTRHTAILAGKGRTQRAEALRDAFRPRRSAARTLTGRVVLLVDDVLTTGATCGSAARALKRAGAARVVAVTIARAEGRP